MQDVVVGIVGEQDTLLWGLSHVVDFGFFGLIFLLEVSGSELFLLDSLDLSLTGFAHMTSMSVPLNIVPV